MSEERAPKASPTDRRTPVAGRRPWQMRRSSRTGRRVWAVVYLSGWAVWTWVIYRFAASHGHQDWLGGNEPTFAALGALTFWPFAILHWRLVYPADPRALPWDQSGD